MLGGPGLQPERTALAWQRTGVTGVAVAGSTLAAALHVDVPAAIVMAALGTVLSALAVGVAVVRGRADVAVGAPWPHLVAVAAIPVALAPAGVLLAVLT